jgi:hypothetical protein
MIDESLSLSQKRSLAGSLGGRATVKKYGKRYMKKLGKWGAHRMHSTYRMVACDLNDFALVNVETGLVKAYLSGKAVDDPERFLGSMPQDEELPF